MVRARPEVRRDPVRTADDQSKVTASRIAPPPKPGGKSRRAYDLAPLVKNAAQCARWQRFLQQRGLGIHPAAFAIFHFYHLRRTKSDPAAHPVKPGEIIGDKLSLRARAKTADRDNVDAQGGAYRVLRNSWITDTLPRLRRSRDIGDNECFINFSKHISQLLAAALSAPSHIFSSW